MDWKWVDLIHHIWDSILSALCMRFLLNWIEVDWKWVDLIHIRMGRDLELEGGVESGDSHVRGTE